MVKTGDPDSRLTDAALPVVSFTAQRKPVVSSFTAQRKLGAIFKIVSSWYGIDGINQNLDTG